MDSQNDQVPSSTVSHKTSVKPARPRSTLVSSSSSLPAHLPDERSNRAAQAENENIAVPEPTMALAAYTTPMKTFRQELQDFKIVLRTRTASAFPGENLQAIKRLMNMTMPSYTFRSYAKSLKTLGIDLPGFKRNNPSKTPWMTNLYDASDQLQKEEGRSDRTQHDTEIQADILAAKLAACNVCWANTPFLAPGEPVYETYSGENLQEALESHNASPVVEETPAPLSSEPDSAEDRFAFLLLRRHAQMRTILKEMRSNKGPAAREAAGFFTPRAEYRIELAVYGWNTEDFIHIETTSVFSEVVNSPSAIKKQAKVSAGKGPMFRGVENMKQNVEVSMWMWITGNGQSWKCFKPISADAGVIEDYVSMLQDQFELSDEDEEECGEIRCMVYKKVDAAGAQAWLAC